eukprot:CAMPEP_0184488068 /NCGR_PEP_ID=MMETSP0113_2-20130426/10508_1 /TAXON_ID=91329 /ORGANISM="Norrisiella sphaerica, Strain BC52" /LENGTH=738 /DNA_ID=CAMNT_0026870541 /DNA_START=185 /DNA_END=2401 /DNA_ORIENTATION=-
MVERENTNGTVIAGLNISEPIRRAIEEIAPGTGLGPNDFWHGFADLVRDFSERNSQLLEERDTLQRKIDKFHEEHLGNSSPEKEEKFLREIGYLTEPTESKTAHFQIETRGLDPEVSSVPAPQLVVPVDNERYALNAANARWGSLLDAYYGTDAIGRHERQTKGYDPQRGKEVFVHAERFLDEHFPLTHAKYADVTKFELVDGGYNGRKELVFRTKEGVTSLLQNPQQFVGYSLGKVTKILFKNNGLHVELQIDPNSRIGKTHRAGIKDIVLESALTTICDCEDSVAAVDAEDKAKVYLNWFGLMNGSLSTEFKKQGRVLRRSLNKDRVFNTPNGGSLTLPGRALLLVRNVGIHMYTDAVTHGRDNKPVPEGLLDLAVTCFAAKHDLMRNSDTGLCNSRSGSVYIVKPKMHGPREVEFVLKSFERVEAFLGLPEKSVKIGIMDEERRTTVNLPACLNVAKDRVFFVNTGFLDRTGDEIHTCMRAGPVLPKEGIKRAVWKTAYEAWNVDVSLKLGLKGVGQIGKGMWAAPDRMADMLSKKVSELKQGASTAWVPSPTAATLHAIHYHRVKVLEVQERLRNRAHAALTHILTLPLNRENMLDGETVAKELENNAQGILGYVARWIHKGVGCSKIPDIHNIGLMEDRATLRISSQHIANWLLHRVITREQVIETFRKMAVLIDRQNQKSGVPSLANNFEKDPAVRASLELVFEGTKSPNGYTEPILHKYRRSVKQGHGVNN